MKHNDPTYDDLSPSLLDRLRSSFTEILLVKPQALQYYICPYNALAECLPQADDAWPLLSAKSYPSYMTAYYVGIMAFLDQTEGSWMSKVGLSVEQVNQTGHGYQPA